jgi:hypothetical protein
MSNRIAGSRIDSRIELGAWAPAPRISQWDRLSAAVRDWRQQAVARRDLAALPPRMRRDLGLADVVATHNTVLDFETRRCRF